MSSFTGFAQAVRANPCVFRPFAQLIAANDSSFAWNGSGLRYV